MPKNKKPRAPVAVDVSAAAAALGRIGGRSTSARKHASSQKNILKAQAASTRISVEARREKAKKAAAARWSKVKNSKDRE